MLYIVLSLYIFFGILQGLPFTDSSSMGGRQRTKRGTLGEEMVAVAACSREVFYSSPSYKE
jgi:hypothetical protein